MGWAVFAMALFGFQWVVQSIRRNQRRLRKDRDQRWRDFKAGR
jgi:hypothetical protein